MKIVVTGTGGLLGWHAAARLHAANCAARYRGELPPFDLVCLDRAAFNDRTQLAASLSGADAVLHFAGVNRGTENEVREGNPTIARVLIDGCREAGSAPHIVYANSTHAKGESVYASSKRIAADILASGQGAFTNVVLPHIFGECARPNYNGVTATLIENLWSGATPRVAPHGSVRTWIHAACWSRPRVQKVPRKPLSPRRAPGTVAVIISTSIWSNGFWSCTARPLSASGAC